MLSFHASLHKRSLTSLLGCLIFTSFMLSGCGGSNSQGASSQSQAPPTKGYTVTDVGVPASATGIFPGAINNMGQVVGSYRLPSKTLRPFLWTSQRGLEDLGLLNNAQGGAATSINDAGTVVGYMTQGATTDSAFVWTQDKGLQSLPTPPELTAAQNVSIEASSINVGGQIIGSALRPNRTTAQLLLWPSPSQAQLQPLSGFPMALNSSGLIVGAQNNQAEVWSLGQSPVNTGALPGYIGNSTATAVNTSGMVVGWIIKDSTPASNSSSTDVPVATGLPSASFLRTPDGSLQNLGFLPGTDQSYANAINDQGVVVGTSAGGTNHFAFVWTAARGILNLNDYLPSNPGLQLNQAIGINDGGQILATGILNGMQHGFLLTPRN